MQERVIAIDGPAGSGKSTAARKLAQALGYTYLNTGAMYRAVAFLAQEGGINLTDGDQVAAIAENMRFAYTEHHGRQRFILDGVDRTDALFTAALTAQLKPVVNHNGVRAVLVRKMQEAARTRLKQGAPGVVLEGRDIGTVVFPNALLKFYIHAGLDARTQRRAAELRARHEPVDFEGLRRQIRSRDEADEGREVGALKKAPDALDIDTTALDEDATLRRLLEEVQKRGLQ